MKIECARLEDGHRHFFMAKLLPWFTRRIVPFLYIPAKEQRGGSLHPAVIIAVQGACFADRSIRGIFLGE